MDISSETTYNAGNLALDAIADLPKENIDPKNGGNYRIGVVFGEYEVAGTLEDTDTSYILGSFKKRTASGSVATLAEAPDTTNNILTLANFNDALKYDTGDTI